MTAAQEPTELPEPPLREDALTYTPTPRSIPRARRRTAQLVAEWGYPELAADTALLVSELATNVLLHGCLRDRLFRVRIALTPTTLRVEVTDPRGERTPQPRTAETAETAETADQFGRGLLIVTLLAHRWGTTPHTVGKTVFAELQLPPLSREKRRPPRSPAPAPRSRPGSVRTPDR